MLRQLKTYLCSALLLTAAATFVTSTACAKGWEPVRAERADAKHVVREPELEIKTSSGLIMVSTSHAVQIKVFTILGRLVSSETVQPGKSQLQLPAHGVYIVKVGDLTCKVAV